jgi:hypothetical protein
METKKAIAYGTVAAVALYVLAYTIASCPLAFG